MEGAEQHFVIENTDGFNLQEFCKWAMRKGWGSKIKVEREDWLSIVSYVASCGFDPVMAGHALNDVFNLDGRFPIHENAQQIANVQRHFRPNIATTRQAIEYILNRAWPNQYSSKLFWSPKKKYRFYEDYTRFVNGTGAHDLEEVERFFSDTIEYIRKGKYYVFRSRNERFDSQKNKYITEDIEFDQKAPFSGEDRINILINPTIGEFRGELEGLKKRTAKAKQSKFDMDEIEEALKQLDTCSTVRATALCKPFKISLRPQKVSSEKIMKRLQADHMLTRFSKQEFFPFHGKDPTPDNVWNSFSGFPILDYRPQRKVDVTKTASWKILSDEQRGPWDAQLYIGLARMQGTKTGGKIWRRTDLHYQKPQTRLWEEHFFCSFDELVWREQCMRPELCERPHLRLQLAPELEAFPVYRRYRLLHDERDGKDQVSDHDKKNLLPAEAKDACASPMLRRVYLYEQC